MKIDRLIGILSILLQQEKVTAPYLAEKFEVSRRTINRDVEALCKAGIPIVTAQGKNGGISVMDGYRMDRTILTRDEMQAILAGLRGVDSVSGTSRYRRLMDKLSGETALSGGGPIRIDLASWYRSSLAPKIDLLRVAIGGREKISFDYYAPGGESRRVAEPYLLIFQWASWYLWAYCEEREDYRMFKLNRMQKLQSTGERFEPRDWPEPVLDSQRIFPGLFKAEAAVEPSVRWRLVEEYGVESFEEMGDGRLLFRQEFADKESLFGWILSFAGQAELLTPAKLRRELAELLRRMGEAYEIQEADSGG